MTRILETDVGSEAELRMEPGADHAGLGYEELSHRELLRRARLDVEERGLTDVLIVDADFHQSEERDWREILGYMDNQVIEHFLRTGGGGRPWFPGSPTTAGIQEAAGRIRPTPTWNAERAANPAPTRAIAEAAEMLSLDYILLFPQQLLGLGRTQFLELEVHVARAYARWLVEHVLEADSRVLGPLYLPFSDPDACVALVEEFGEHPGIVAATTVTNRYEPTHDKAYLRLYAMLEERELPLLFHAGIRYDMQSQSMFNRFISVHGVGFPYLVIAQATNWIVNALPERFPGLKIAFIEGGLAWIPFLMQRLDHMAMMRSSEVPLLKKLPSEYLRDFYYTTQPLEATNVRELKATLDFINANDKLMYASDWPHWDWDPPSRIWDLPFLDEDVRRGILGGNAAELFKLDRVPAAG
ncbi:MAG: amidohydrolase family protein [Solirubrobacteraceae bacterium]